MQTTLPRVLCGIAIATIWYAGVGLVAQPVTNGLVVYLNFDNNIAAQAGTTNNGTAVGADPTPKYVPGIIGASAALFNNDGTGTTPGDWAVSLGDIEQLYASSWSFSLWVNATNNNDGALFGNKDWTSGADVGWLFDPSRISFLNYACQGTARHDIGGVNILDGRWHHVVGVFNRSTNGVSVYTDGSLTAAANLATSGLESLTPTNFTPNVTLIGGSGDGLYSGAGAIDDLGMWDRTLTPDEVLAIYSQGLNGQPLTSAIAGTAIKPVITGQPQSLTIYAGFPATFSVTASGSAPLVYHWFHNGAALAGATNTAFVIAQVGTNDAGTYTVVVTNQFGSATNSPQATLAVTPPASSITNQLVVYLNFDSNLVAQAGTTNSAVPIGNVGIPNYTNGVIGSAALFQNDQGSGPAASDWAASLGDVEWIYSNNWSFSLWVKTTDTLGAVLGNKDWSSGGNIGWLISEYYVNFLNYTAVNSPRHDIGNFNWADNKWHQVAAVFYRDINQVYTYVDGNQTAQAPLSTTGFESLTPANIVPNATLVGSSGDGAYSANAAVDDLGMWTRPLTANEILSIYAQGLKSQPLTTVLENANLRPEIVTPPHDLTLPEGFRAQFSVVASGSSALFYQWYRNGGPMAGQTNSTLSFLASIADSGSAFTVVVSNQFGFASNSIPAILTVTPGAASITDSLVVYLNFDSNLVAQASTTNSATPIGNVGIPKYTTGIIGSAALFENDQGASPTASDWAASLGDIEWVYTNNWSFSIWVKTTDTLGAVFGNKDWTSGSNIGWLISEYYTNFLNYKALNSARYDIGSFNWADNSWHQVAAVFYRDLNLVYTYVDGRQTAQAPLSATGFESLTPSNITPNATLIGSSGNATYSANAAVDDLGMWTRPLAEAEVAAIYQSGLVGRNLTQAVSELPKLTAKLSGNQVVVGYPSSATNFTLASSLALAPAVWTLVTNAPTSSNGTTFVTVPLAGGARFFRLQQ